MLFDRKEKTVMVVKNSIRQLMRTPVKTLFFFVLLVFTITFFILGYNLQLIAARNIDHIKNTFTTIGTVEQKAISSGTGLTKIGGTEHGGMYSSVGRVEYGSRLPVSVLDFKGADYILKPEQRPLYIAYDPGYIINLDPEEEKMFDITNLIVEMEPLKNGVTGGKPVRMKIKKVLYGKLDKDEILFNTLDTTAIPLYAGKTYIAYLNEGPQYPGYDEFQYIPDIVTRVTQFTKDGERIKDTMPVIVPLDEVTGNFFETLRGKRWLAVLEGAKRLKHEIPVIPTNGTKLLMAFYNGNARINEGRDISPEEYQNGEKVCLVSRNFARNNGLAVGDSLRLPLYYADYRLSSSQVFCSGMVGANINKLVNAKGESYSAFEDSMYRIVGTYDDPYLSGATGYELGYNSVVIPSASVKKSDENNIVGMGPMKGYTTSFQISNGEIEEYMRKWEALGITNLKIKFYDKGYSKVRTGLQTMMNTALILFAVGAVTTLLVVILFCNLFITKQRKRTAIERSLGMSKRLCTVSLLAGLLFIVVAAYVFGSVAGYGLTDYTVKHVNITHSQEAFDSAYSDWGNSSDANSISNVEISKEGTAQGALVAAMVIPVAFLLAFVSLFGNLRSEPLKLLGEKER